MDNYIFIISSRGDRTNIMANFKVITKEDFIKYVKEEGTNKLGRMYGDSFRYSKIGGYADNVKSMSLKEFELLFSKDTFTPDEITTIFRKEISEKYGKHLQMKQMKLIKKSELVVGNIYEIANGEFELYLGKIERTIYKNGNVEEVLEGEGWHRKYCFNITKSENEDYFMSYCRILKTNPKVVKDLGKLITPTKTEYIRRYEHGWSRKDKLEEVTIIL